MQDQCRTQYKTNTGPMQDPVQDQYSTGPIQDQCSTSTESQNAYKMHTKCIHDVCTIHTKCIHNAHQCIQNAYTMRTRGVGTVCQPVFLFLPKCRQQPRPTRLNHHDSSNHTTKLANPSRRSWHTRQVLRIHLERARCSSWAPDSGVNAKHQRGFVISRILPGVVPTPSLVVSFFNDGNDLRVRQATPSVNRVCPNKNCQDNLDVLSCITCILQLHQVGAGSLCSDELHLRCQVTTSYKTSISAV